MTRAELWEYIKDNHPDHAVMLREFREQFGRVTIQRFKDDQITVKADNSGGFIHDEKHNDTR